MKQILRALAVALQIVAARRAAQMLMADPMRVWPPPGRVTPVEEPEPVEPVAPDTPMGPDLLLDGQELEWFEVSGCVCKAHGVRHLVCPAHPEGSSK